MQQSKHVKAMLLSAAAVGLGSFFASSANAGTGFTWNQTLSSGGYQWNTPADWSQAGSGAYPTNASDTALLNVSLYGTQTLIVPSNITLGSIVLGDTLNNYGQTLYNGGGTITMDNGGASATATIAVKGQAATSAETVFYNMQFNSNSNLVIADNGGHSGGHDALWFDGGTGYINAPGRTVTFTNPLGSQAPVIYGYWQMTAGLWIVSSGAHFEESGNEINDVTGDILILPGGGWQEGDYCGHSTNALITDQAINGVAWNMGSGPENVGAISGSGVMNGPGALVLGGNTDATSTPDYSGSSYVTYISMTGGTQRLSGTVSNQTGPVTVSGGVLQLNKTSGYAVSSVSGGTLTIATGGTVQLLQSNTQIDPAVPVTFAGGKLQINQFSQNFNGALNLTAGSTIDFGTGLPASGHAVLQFADSSSQVWAGTTDILNWNGASAGAGYDVLFVGGTNDLSTGMLAELKFINPIINGVLDTGTFAAAQLASGEVVPTGSVSVPEPATLGLIGMAGAMLTLRRRRK